MSKYSGLWLMEKLIEVKLAKMESDSEKRTAPKYQLRFRQIVIFMCPSDKKKFFFFLKWAR